MKTRQYFDKLTLRNSYTGEAYSVGQHGTFYDVQLSTGRVRRRVTGWIEALHETKDAGFAKVYCTDKECFKTHSPGHVHIVCLG